MAKFKIGDKVKFFNYDGLSAEGVVSKVRAEDYNKYSIQVTKILKADQYITDIFADSKGGLQWGVPEVHVRPLKQSYIRIFRESLENAKTNL